jgi:uncharacterized Zn finger protein
VKEVNDMDLDKADKSELKCKKCGGIALMEVIHIDGVLFTPIIKGKLYHKKRDVISVGEKNDSFIKCCECGQLHEYLFVDDEILMMIPIERELNV